MDRNNRLLRTLHLLTPLQALLITGLILFILVYFSPFFSYAVAPDPSHPEDTFQPAAPYYATFYYPWYMSSAIDSKWSYWTDEGNQPPDSWFSHYLPDIDPQVFEPANELYSSFDPEALKWQLEKMAEARLEVAISSWFGPGHKTDKALRFMLADMMQRPDNPHPDLRWTVYYEREGNADPSAAEIASDLDYISMELASQSGYLHINGKPVIFVYADSADSIGMVQRWHEANQQAAIQFHVVLKVFAGYELAQPQPDGWHQYAPAKRVSAHPPDSIAISPGFWLDDGSPALLPRDIEEFRAAVSQMVRADAEWKLVTTWNEWGEGTSIEPGDPATVNPQSGREEFDDEAPPFQNLYVDILAELLPPLGAGGDSSPMPEPGGTLPPPIFSFAAAGDHGANKDTTAVLRALKRAEVDFYLALGDLSYKEAKPETAWCDFVKSEVGADFPFELLVGNHEDQPGDDGYIDNFAACLPDQLNSTGLYAHRYYFDYPPAAPIARIILIDPNTYRGDERVEYCKKEETENCNWLKARIAEAQQQGKWVIVGMHKNCITAGTKSCEISSELLDMLVNARVDLILQGHEHIYQRSKQLALNETCLTIAVNDYDPACVVDDGEDSLYYAGAGPVIVINGAGGHSLRDVHQRDREAPYFATWMGSDVTPSHGFVQYDLSACAISAQFVNAVGQYTDSFVIRILPDMRPECDFDDPTPPTTPDTDTNIYLPMIHN